VGQGKYNADPLTNSTYYTLSPYVMADNVTDYGTGFSFTAATGVTKEAADTTLVVSPITAACSACHDSSASIDHMQANGGRFYDTRANYKAKGALKEQCMICHATGKVAPIATVHK
jgi:OmcA/MtrC family decaheme c-type cytochrome